MNESLVWCGRHTPPDNATPTAKINSQEDEMKSKFSATMKDDHLVVELNLSNLSLESVDGFHIYVPDDFAPIDMSDPWERFVIDIYGVPKRSTTALTSGDAAR